MEIIFRVTGPLCGNSPVIFSSKGQWRGIWCFLWSVPWINGWVNNLVIWDAFALIVTSYFVIVMYVMNHDIYFNVNCLLELRIEITWYWAGGGGGGGLPYKTWREGGGGGGLWQVWLCEIYDLICQNTAVRVCGVWIKRHCVLCSKTYFT